MNFKLINFKLACIFFGSGFIFIQILPVLDEFDFILDFNMSTRLTEVCYVILCLTMSGIS